MNKKHGFTIIEIVVVIVVIGILATIGVIGYGNWRNSTITAQLKSDLTNAATAMENYRNFNSGYPLNINDLTTFKPSPGVTITGGSTDGGKSFSLSAINNGISYLITDKTSSVSGKAFNATSAGRLGTIQTFTVPNTGKYRISVLGASGGIATPYRGGYGASVSADFNLSAGTVLQILVGQKGLNTSYAPGGGASGVWIAGAATPLIVAGGGGGANSVANPHIGGDANLINNGTASYGVAGTGGNGGGAGYYGWVGGGAGWSSNGGGGYPAIALKNGGNGGAYNSSYEGGFGGGGSGYGGGGGGGGYSGGGGGYYTIAGSSFGGGGGSYTGAQGADPSLILGNNTGHGLIMISSI